MREVRRYHLQPTEQILNSHFPLLHYRGVLADAAGKPELVYDLLTDNGWVVNWIFRYGPTQASHYHSRSHECMAVLTGTATIRFGAADTSDDLEASSYGSAWESGGVELQAEAGDVFVIPAGVAHKTYRTTPAEFQLLTPGQGKGIEAADPRQSIADITLSGYTMLGAYPGGFDWDFVLGSTDRGEWHKVWAVEKPVKDPVLGESSEGLCGLWQGERKAAL